MRPPSLVNQSDTIPDVPFGKIYRPPVKSSLLANAVIKSNNLQLAIDIKVDYNYTLALPIIFGRSLPLSVCHCRSRMKEHFCRVLTCIRRIVYDCEFTH